MSLVVPRSRELAGDSENQPALLTCRSRVWCYLLSLEAFEVCLLWLKLVSRLQCCKLAAGAMENIHRSCTALRGRIMPFSFRVRSRRAQGRYASLDGASQP